jgi:hypothetical protein
VAVETHIWAADGSDKVNMVSKRGSKVRKWSRERCNWNMVLRILLGPNGCNANTIVRGATKLQDDLNAMA